MITYLYINRVCNNHCIFCASSKTVLKEGPKEISREDLYPSLKEAKRISRSNYILISGGEPTIYPYIFEAVSKARALFAHVTFATNAVKLADPVFARGLISAGVDYIAVPFYSTKPHVHNFLTRGKNAFSNSMQGVINAKKEGVKIGIKTFVSKYTQDELLNIFSWAYNLLGHDINFILDSMRYSPALSINTNAFTMCTFHWTVVAEKIEKAVRLMLEAKVNLRIERIPLCVFSQDTLLELIQRNYISHKRDKIYRILPGNKFDIVDPEVIEPAFSEYCDCCILNEICGKCYKNAKDHTGFLKFAKPFTLGGFSKPLRLSGRC